MASNLIIALSIFAFSSCTMTKESSQILPNVAIDKGDNYVIFSYSSNGKTGLYKLDLNTGSVSNWLKPGNGLIFSPSYSADDQFLIYVMTEKDNNNEWANVIYMAESDGIKRKKILSLNSNIIDAVVTPDGERIYFTTAAYIGNSSPVAKPTAKEMNIYSVDIKGENLRKETNISAYNIGGKLAFDLSGKNLFFQMFNYERDSIEKAMGEKNGSSKLHKNCGPYMFDVDNKELKSLIPSNADNLHNKGINNFLPDFLYPVPTNEMQEIFLLSATTVYKMNLTTMKAQFFYEESEDERINKRYHVQTFIPLHQKNKYLMIKQTGKNESSFFILNEKGEVFNTFTPNDEQLKKDFK